MAKAEVPDEGAAAWRRLTARRGPGTGDEALAALADIGAVRRVLDQWELRAVRVARSRNKSWAEIATYLGVTRQSAWERWRDLDTEPTPAPDTGDAGSSDPATELLESESTELVAELLEPGARSSRRRANVRVPSVVGLEWARALHALTDKGLVAANADPDAPLPDPAESGWLVTDQSPESGARVATGTVVRLWLRRNGGAGVREPRQPLPPLRSIPELPEPTGRHAG